jgi:hypothetical protein
MPFIGNKPSAVPLTSADIADSIITSAKIVDATIANADIANSTINLTTKVTGTLPVANGGTGLAALGTSLQVLRTNTGATALEFASASSDFVKLLSTTASASAAVSIDGYFTSDYDKYVLYLNGGYMSTSNRINLKVNKSGTAQTGSYTHTSFGHTNQPTTVAMSETDYFHMGYWSNSSSRTNDAVIQIFNPLGTTYAKGFIWNIGGKDNAYDLWSGGAGVHNSNTAISGITILNQAGHTFTIDKITLYGIK